MHKLSDKVLITPALLRRFEAEGQFQGADGRFYAIICKSDGSLVRHLQGPTPAPEQELFAQDMAVALNRHLAHDGAWVVVFTHPPKVINRLAGFASILTYRYERWVFLWMDRDGDVQFPMECTEPFDLVVRVGPDPWMTQAEASWESWNDYRKALDLRPHETVKRAQGQANQGPFPSSPVPGLGSTTLQ